VDTRYIIRFIHCMQTCLLKKSDEKHAVEDTVHACNDLSTNHASWCGRDVHVINHHVVHVDLQRVVVVAVEQRTRGRVHARPYVMHGEAARRSRLARPVSSIATPSILRPSVLLALTARMGTLAPSRRLRRRPKTSCHALAASPFLALGKGRRIPAHGVSLSLLHLYIATR
jgi:hypothetical protein